jgi:two-component system chemotaxis response regulator CheY
MRALIKKELAGLGFTGNILEADNADDGFRIIKDGVGSPVPIELVISDWKMPGTSGYDFLKKVRATPEIKDLPFLMATSQSDMAVVMDAVSAGVSNYILKPVDGALLKQKLVAVWQKHRKV